MSTVFNSETTPIRGTMLLEASAGTGKTWALEQMVTRLVGREENPLTIDQILVVTFTNKAAREMKERIRQIITEKAATNQKGYIDALASFDKASIYTIHGFCRTVLSSWPFEASVPFEQEIVSGYELEIEETRNWLASSAAEEIFDEYNVQAAWKRVGSTENLIGAIVSGLTDTSTPEGAILLPSMEEMDSFLAFAEDAEDPNGRLWASGNGLFGREWSAAAIKAIFQAAGMRKQPDSLGKIQAYMAACSGIRGLSALEDWLFGDPAELGIRNHFQDMLFAINTIDLDEQALQGEAWKLGNALKKFIGIIENVVEFRPNDSRKKVASLILKYQENAFHYRIQNILKPRIEARKNTLGRWNFGDLVKRTANALAVEGSPLKAVLQARFKAAIIDEFQDTDPLQWQMFKSLFYTPSHILVLIGDPKQCIYGFRGTGLTAYRAASVLVPEKQRYRLDTNWRSSSRLVNAVNRLFEPVFQNRCGNGTPVGFTAVKAGKTVDRQLEWPGAEKPISLVPAENEATAAKSIVSEIRAILDSRTGAVWTMDNGHTHPVEASDIVVLVRSGLQENDVISRLSALNIPAIRYRDASIFNQPLIPMLTALLEAIKEPRNMHLIKGVLSGAFFRLPPDMLLQFEEAGYLDNFPEWSMEIREMFNSGHSVRALAAFFSYAAEMGKWAGQFKREAEAKRLSRPWTIRVLSEPGGERLWQDWNHIGEIIQERQSAGMRDISRIISWLKTNADSGLGLGEESAQIRMTTEAPAVTVMTMHSAKGLEFPLVFLHGGYKGSSRRSDKTGSDYRFETDDALMVDRLCREQYFNAHRAHSWEEEKRLWYVAFTRASVKLWVPLPVGEEKKTAQLDSLWGLMTGQLDGFAALPPHELQDSKLDQFRKQIGQKIRNSFQELIHFPDPAASDTPEPLSRNIQKSGRLAPLPDSYTGSRDPVTSSFTSLVHQSENTAAIGDRDRDVREEDGSISNANVLLPDDSGLEFGQFVHACMELCDINLAADADAWQNDDETDRLFADQSARYYPPGWYQSRSADVKTLIRLGLCAPIPGLSRICDLEPGTYRREIEFQMHVPEHAHLRLGNAQDSADSLMQLGRGFLKGYIDLLACKDGQWWVLDWKTNMPRHGQSWEEAMSNHHYRFQYELYLLALCRTLHAAWNRPVDWENEIGGAAYVFLRGLHSADPAHSQGLIVEKPGLEKMHALADLLACSEIIA